MTIEVYPKMGETYPDAQGVPITSVGAIVDESKYIQDAVRDGFLLTWDPYGIYQPDDRTGSGGGPPSPPLSAPPNVAAASAIGTPGRYATEDHTHGHGDQAGGTLHATATTSVAGFMSGADKTKLDALPTSPAPDDAEYLVAALHAGLTNERVLIAGSGISLTPSAGALTVAATGSGPTAPVSAPPDVAAASAIGTLGAYATETHTHGHGNQAGGALHANAVAGGAAGFMSGTDKAQHDALHAAALVLLSNSADFPNERALAAGTGVTLTDGGAGAALTVATPNAVQGPASATANVLARYDGTTGKLIKNSAVSLDDSGVLSSITALGVSGNITVGGTVDGVDVAGANAASFLTLGANAFLPNDRVLTAGTGVTLTDGGAGGALTVSTPNAVQRAGASTDNAIARYDGTSGALIQNSACTIDDAGLLNASSMSANSATFTSLAVTVNITVGGTVDGVDIAGANAASFVTLGTSGFMANERVLTAGNGITVTDGGAGSTVTVAVTRPVVNWATATLTLGATHNGALIVASDSTNQTLTIPTNASVPLPIGFSCRVQQNSSNSNHDVVVSVTGITIKVDLLVGGSTAISHQLVDNAGWVEYVKIGTDSWLGYGKVT